MGLALGIDYTLFILSRYREERAQGREKLEAIATAGRRRAAQVLFSGLAFVLAMTGMLLVPSSIMRSLAAGAILVGIVSVIAALTLLPAVLSLLGDRVNALRIPYFGRNVGTQSAQESRFWGRIVGLRHEPPGGQPRGNSVAPGRGRLADLLVRDGLVRGFDAARPLRRQARLRAPERGVPRSSRPIPCRSSSTARLLRRRFGRESSGWAMCSPRRPALRRADRRSEPGRRHDADPVPLGGDAVSEPAIEAVRDLRTDVVPEVFADTDADVLVGGDTAVELEYHGAMDTWLPRVFAFVLGLSFILLAIAFRSIVVPATAIAMNLLAVGATYGILVLVFIKGIGNNLFGFEQVDHIEAWVPLFLFSVLFGLSMDYQVFLLSRIREFSETGDNRHAIAFGVGRRLVSSRALR